MSAYLGCHSPGDATHGMKQRQATAVIGYRLVSNGRYAGTHQRPCLARVGGQMQICKQYLSRRESAALVKLWFLHFDDQLSFPEHRISAGCDSGSGCLIFGIDETHTDTGASLHEHIVSIPGEGGCAIGGEGHAIFMVFDFLRHSDFHDGSLLGTAG